MSSAGVSYTREAGVLVVRLVGEWRHAVARPDSRELERELAQHSARSVRFDANELEGWNTQLLTFLADVAERARGAGAEVDASGLPEGVRKLLALVEAVPEGTQAVVRPDGVLARIGRWAIRFVTGALDFLRFLGRVALSATRLVTFRARVRGSDFLLYLQQTGAEALPIVTLISIIVGMILAFVGALQLRQFGAGIFIANMVGIAMVREMGAMMTGIIMAGRTGAAFAAQLGTMQVNEEVDALVTFGIDPIDFLVLPRILALCLTMPLLCLYADFLGILGGAVVGSEIFGLSSELYWRQTLRAIDMNDLWIGLVKAEAYGVLVAVAGCLRGMQTRGSAAAVGSAATSAVVTGIVAIVVADGVFAVLCEALGV